METHLPLDHHLLHLVVVDLNSYLHDMAVLAVLVLVVEVVRQLVMEDPPQELHSLALQAQHHHQLVGDIMVGMVALVPVVAVVVVLEA